MARLMKENGIRAKTQCRYKATTNSKHSYPVAENLLNQEFIAYKSNQIWVSNITSIPTQEEWLYFIGGNPGNDWGVIGVIRVGQYQLIRELGAGEVT